MECNKVRQRYCPDLFWDFADTKDPRNLSYTDYSNREMLGTMFYKGIAGITSMQAVTDEFNKNGVVKNLYRFMGGKEKEFLPHGVTVNEYFERLDPEELQKVQQKQVYGLVRSKAFYDARFRKKWLVIVEGTQTYSGSRKLHEGCLERHYKKGTEEETVNYHCDVLEAKIVLGEKLIVNIGSEFIENNGEDAERQTEKYGRGRKEAGLRDKSVPKASREDKERVPAPAGHPAGGQPVRIGPGDGYLPGERMGIYHPL